MLLFLPGIDGSGNAGSTQWPRLATTFEVHALSFTPNDQSSFEDVIDGCITFLADTAAGRGSLIVGESTGAVAALGVALRAPSAVDGLCLVNPATSYSGSALSAVAPLLPQLPRNLYRAAPFVVTPLFGKPDWFRTIVEAGPPPLIPTPADVLAASEALADVLTPEALAWRLEAQLETGARRVNELLGSRPTPTAAAATLLLAGGRDFILPSVRETARLQERLPGSVRKVLPFAGHACLDDARALNLRLELALSGVLDSVLKAHTRRQQLAAAAMAADEPPAAAAEEVVVAGEGEAETTEAAAVVSWLDEQVRVEQLAAQQAAAAAAKAAEAEELPSPPRQQPEASQPEVDPAPASLFEAWLQSMRRVFSPLFYSVGEAGRIERGVLQLPLPPAGTPILFVGNHQLYGFDGPLIVEEMLRERGRLLRPMVFPPLLAKDSPLAPFPYPLPGTAETFERFGATPVSARSLYGALAKGESVLLFPGGAREVFKRKGEEYQIFWGDDADIVRLAARCNATIVPFSGLGGDESFAMALDSEELLDTPLVGDFFRERVDALPSLVPGDVFVPPFGAITPQRHYFLFGAPIDLTSVDPADREACARVYDDVRAAVRGGVSRLQQEVRDEDEYRDLVKRSAWEALFDAQAPGPK